MENLEITETSVIWPPAKTIKDSMGPVIHFPTKTEYDTFVVLWEGLGAMFRDGASLVTNDKGKSPWDEHQGETCIHICDWMLGSKESFERDGMKPMTYKELLKRL